MTSYNSGSFDIAVIGAGHAGVEAALAAARLGCRVVCFATNLDAVANLPCNPAIGGSAKGQLVREIDALGGQMAKTADLCCIQYRMLNRGKGPAVHALRAQADRIRYRETMKQVLEKQENLSLKQAEVVDIIVKNNKVYSVLTSYGGAYKVSCAIVATGTFLRGRVIIGEFTSESGPDGLLPATMLSESLKRMGLPLQRFKTGTPPRILSRSVDFSQMEEQPGDDNLPPFSFSTLEKPRNLASCYLTHTTAETHEIIRKNLHRSPLYSGVIEGVGPRYCPSIEDKIVRFADKERHHLFLEPMGLSTDELYLQGLSSSLPEDVQLEAIRSIPGLQNAEVSRPAYAIEYDCVDPLALESTLETKAVKGLYGAGQFCGSSGYEEAAAQGLAAGINAAHSVLGREPFVLDRSTSYIGTLIDDLVTRGTHEPYRMMTSRSEYRLLLRHDNADVRLMSIGYKIGLISQAVYQNMLNKTSAAEAELTRLNKVMLSPTDELNVFLTENESTPVVSGIRITDLIRRPELSYKSLAHFDRERPELPFEVCEQVEISLKYEGYIKRQLAHVEAFKKLESKRIPPDLDYASLHGLRLEARQKLAQVRPQNLGQAGRVSGVNPADITALMIHLGN